MHQLCRMFRAADAAGSRAGRIAGLRLVADDADRSWGAGEPVHGPIALAMAITGGPVLGDLRGSGVSQLADQLRSRHRTAGP